MHVFLLFKEISHDTRRFRFALPSMDHILGLPVGKYRDYEYSSSVLGTKVTVECIYQKKVSNMSLPCALTEVKSTKNIIPILMHFYETQTDGNLQPTETQTDRY